MLVEGVVVEAMLRDRYDIITHYISSPQLNPSQVTRAGEGATGAAAEDSEHMEGMDDFGEDVLRHFQLFIHWSREGPLGGVRSSALVDHLQATSSGIGPKKSADITLQFNNKN